MLPNSPSPQSPLSLYWVSTTYFVHGIYSSLASYYLWQTFLSSRTYTSPRNVVLSYTSLYPWDLGYRVRVEGLSF